MQLTLVHTLTILHLDNCDILLSGLDKCNFASHFYSECPCKHNFPSPSLWPYTSSGFPFSVASNISCLSSLSRPFAISPHPSYHLSFSTKLLVLTSDRPRMPASITHVKFSNQHLRAFSHSVPYTWEVHPVNFCKATLLSTFKSFLCHDAYIQLDNS